MVEAEQVQCGDHASFEQFGAGSVMWRCTASTSAERQMPGRSPYVAFRR